MSESTLVAYSGAKKRKEKKEKKRRIKKTANRCNQKRKPSFVQSRISQFPGQFVPNEETISRELIPNGPTELKITTNCSATFNRAWEKCIPVNIC